MEAPNLRTENTETNRLAELLRDGIERAHDLFEKTAFTLGFKIPEGKDLSEAEKRETIEKIRRLVGATVAGVVVAGAIPEMLLTQGADARVQNLTIQGEKFEKSITQAEREATITIGIAEIPVGTSVLRIGPSEYLPKTMPHILSNAPLDKKNAAGNSSFQLKEVKEISNKKGEVKRYAIYETVDQKQLKETETVQIPTTVPENSEAQLPLTTNEDQQLSLSRIEAAYQLPIGDKSKSTISEGFYSEATLEFPLTDDGSIKLELGGSYATEYGKPGSTIVAPPVEGKDKGYKISPSLGIAYSPWKESELRAMIQPNFSQGSLDVSEKRPAVVLGSWKQRSDDPHWWQYQVSGAAEFGDEKTIGFIPRFQGRVVLDKVFIANPDLDLDMTIGIGAKTTFLAEEGAQSRKPFQVPVRLGAVKGVELFGQTYELNITTSIAPGRDDLPELAIETSLQKRD